VAVTEPSRVSPHSPRVERTHSRESRL
jgi:hypothetical protein